MAIHFHYDNPNKEAVQVIVPIILSSGEKIKSISTNGIDIEKGKSTLTFTSTGTITPLSTHGGRIFNYVPGLEAIPLRNEQNDAQIEIKVSK